MCPKCHQLVTSARDPHLIVENRSPVVCDSCRAAERDAPTRAQTALIASKPKPQGETVRLFTPAPSVMPGQLGFDA